MRGLLHAGDVVLQGRVGGGAAAAGPFHKGQAHAYHHNVLPLLDVAGGLNEQFAAEAQPPLGAVGDEQAALGVGVAAVGNLAVGVGGGHLLGGR